MINLPYKLINSKGEVEYISKIVTTKSKDFQYKDFVKEFSPATDELELLEEIINLRKQIKALEARPTAKPKKTPRHLSKEEESQLKAMLREKKYHNSWLAKHFNVSASTVSRVKKTMEMKEKLLARQKEL